MDGKRNSNIILGARILMVFFILLFFILFARFIYIQITKSVEGQMLTAIAEEKWTKERRIDARRGSILDRNGEELAKNSPSYTVFAILDETFTKNPNNPQHVIDREEAASKLAPLLKMEEDKLVELMSKEDVFQVELRPGGKDIEQYLKEQIEELDIPGIGFLEESKRQYTNGVFASHTIGYVSDNIGRMGIERLYDEEMQGEPGKITYQSDRKGIRLPNPNEMIEAPKNGSDVYLTIDEKIQTFLEGALTHVEAEYEPEKIIAIVADPKTGEILAVANRPSFDPNLRNINNYMNDTISYPFEPGSTMKIFTLAAAVNEDVFRPLDTYQSGSYRISPNSTPIRDHNKVGWGKISFLEGVQRSSNVAFAKLANEILGTDRLLSYLEKFKLNQKTGIDLPNEASGSLLYRYPVEKITTAFGQGSTVTPIQQIQAATAIANDGRMMRPYITQKIIQSQSGKIIMEGKPEVSGEPISAETAENVRNILRTVVTAPEGTGKPYKIAGYDVAGKTGTAQIPDPETGRYQYGHGNYIFSFLGMAPAENPRLVMYVAVKKPKLKAFETGSDPVSYIFKTVMKNSLHYLNVPPSSDEEGEDEMNEETDGVKLNSYENQQIGDVKAELQSKGVEIVVIGDEGKITSQIPYPNTTILPGDQVVLVTGGEMEMPDLTGWSLRDVMKVAHLLELDPSFIGNGYVTKQNIAPGSKVKQGDYLVVDLSKPSERFQQDHTPEEVEDLPEEFKLDIQD